MIKEPQHYRHISYNDNSYTNITMVITLLSYFLYSTLYVRGASSASSWQVRPVQMKGSVFLLIRPCRG